MLGLPLLTFREEKKSLDPGFRAAVSGSRVRELRTDRYRQELLMTGSITGNLSGVHESDCVTPNRIVGAVRPSQLTE